MPTRTTSLGLLEVGEVGLESAHGEGGHPVMLKYTELEKQESIGT